MNAKTTATTQKNVAFAFGRFKEREKKILEGHTHIPSISSSFLLHTSSNSVESERKKAATLLVLHRISGMIAGWCALAMHLQTSHEQSFSTFFPEET